MITIIHSIFKAVLQNRISFNDNFPSRTFLPKTLLSPLPLSLFSPPIHTNTLRPRPQPQKINPLLPLPLRKPKPSKRINMPIPPSPPLPPNTNTNTNINQPSLYHLTIRFSIHFTIKISRYQYRCAGCGTAGAVGVLLSDEDDEASAKFCGLNGCSSIPSNLV
ncbi:hypothetical protein JAAARDRAFT_651332 [Jaapia argillacea MUCL 33604]|uniref:Uncharacterized protein n=1 Tax=Jaapia argillacea MUCL 33604 TaxID=933084 RepID=A0A067PWH6_9AGAM|nr:hypothetical protein JAAARDRAFT_651332 [Jaapia argillacea MUCL 33604]